MNAIISFRKSGRFSRYILRPTAYGRITFPPTNRNPIYICTVFPVVKRLKFFLFFLSASCILLMKINTDLGALLFYFTERACPTADIL